MTKVVSSRDSEIFKKVHVHGAGNNEKNTEQNKSKNNNKNKVKTYISYDRLKFWLTFQTTLLSVYELCTLVWLFNKDVHFYVQFYRTHDKFPHISFKRWLYSQANKCSKEVVVSLGTLRSRLVRCPNQSSCIGSSGAEGCNWNVLANSIEDVKWSTESFMVSEFLAPNGELARRLSQRRRF